MTKEFLDSIENTSSELESLNKRLAKIENKECTVTRDSVQGSSKSYPYIKHSMQIEGVEVPKNRHLKHKYRKMIKSKKYKLEKLKLQLEYELNYVKEADIREIIRYRYNDNKTWLQIMFLMGYNSEDKARKKLERFLEKYWFVRFVRLKHDKMLVGKKVVAQKWACPELQKYRDKGYPLYKYFFIFQEE